MTSQVDPISWPRTFSLDTNTLFAHVHCLQPPKASTLFYDFHSEIKSNKESFLSTQRTKEYINESRKAFLNSSYEEAPKEEKAADNVPQEPKKTKKISFKIKKSSSIYKRNNNGAGQKVTTYNANTVAELTKKFNRMMLEKNTILEEPKFRKLVRRVNSIKSIDGDVSKAKTSVKTKEFGVKVTRKPSVKTKPLLEKNCKNGKKSKAGRSINEGAIRPNSLNLKLAVVEDASISPVKTTIEIFERRTSECVTLVKEAQKPLVPKPKVPEKKFDDRTKELIAKNKENIRNRIEIQPKKETTKTDFEEDQVQIINIPLTIPQRRCDSMYETTNLKMIPSSRSPTKSEGPVSSNVKPNTSFLWSRTSCQTSKTIANSDGFYDLVETPKQTLEPQVSEVAEIVPEVPPRPSSLPPLKPPTKKPLTDESEKEIYEECNQSEDSLTNNKYESLAMSENVFENKSEVGIYEEYFKSEKPLIKYEEISNKHDETQLESKKPSPRVEIYEENCLSYQSSSKYEHVCNKYEECQNLYEESSNTYERCQSNYEKCSKADDDYEYCLASKENIYETLPPPPPPPLLPKRQYDPLPPRPPSRNSYCTIRSATVSNCYESIYTPEMAIAKGETEGNYESIYEGHIVSGSGSNRDSLVSSDQQSNSLYGRSLRGWADETAYNGKASSDFSSSDRSDDWEDISDNDEDGLRSTGIIVVRERQKPKKTAGWSQCREQWMKSPKKIPVDQGVDSDSDHHYESLHSANEDNQDGDYDSFESDTDSEKSFTRPNLNDSGVDIGNNQLPDPPNSNYVLTRLAATAGKHMRKLRRNWSLTKNDITKSLSRMTKRKSRTDLDLSGKKESISTAKTDGTKYADLEITDPSSRPYQNYEYFEQTDGMNEKSKSLSRKGFLHKFRRSMSMGTDSANELTSNLSNKPKSTFYLTETIQVDDDDKGGDSGVSLSPVNRSSKVSPLRPQSPPPPTPLQVIDTRQSTKKDGRSTSWYAEVGLFKTKETAPVLPKRTNTCWYAEVGLYPKSTSTPSTSSAENSGNNANVAVSSQNYINQENREECNNIKNESDYYNDSINSFSSNETKKDHSLNSLTAELQLRLQDEPLYQFYDAAVLESVCQDGTSDFDSDNYEDMESRQGNISRLSSRPSAMELVSPNRNSLVISRTLWCEIPEVIQSAVLSTLSVHQKKVQEAKFEMLTSEASYLNSLNVLSEHFVKNLENSEVLSSEETNLLFGRIAAVKECSEKLLLDLEKCWQENILLHKICDVVQKHAEENFNVYIPYCEHQVLLDDLLKTLIRERSQFNDVLQRLENSSTCQSLSLYSFLMLPMQRITRWPLLIDAVLKRLNPQDSEYLTCQLALATINRVVNQCNEAAKQKEQEVEMKKLSSQLEFAKGVPPIPILIPNRWLIRSGLVTHMQNRTDETKLTFGKRFSKTPQHLFLFNDLLLVTKPKSENLYSIIHYCPRNLVELSSSDFLVSLPIKDAQGKNLLFLTMLENQEEKTVEFLISCGSESDKERWIEALTAPKSEDPDETLYECWDCPQVTALHNFSASQPDELALVRGDVINVLRKMADGWYHGERIRDGQTGWFPANYTVEIANPHVRARNLKQRYRLLAFSENYFKTK